MFFRDYGIFRIENVYRVKRSSGTASCSPRQFSALAYRISGESVFTSGSEIFHANEGSLLYIPQGQGFSRESSDEELIVIHLNCYDAVGSLEVLCLDDSLFVFERMCGIYDEWQERLPGYESRCTAMLYMLLADIQSGKDTLSTYKSELIKPGVDYINTNYDNPQISIGEISEICHMSSEYFRKLYKAEYGVSPQKAITDKRIGKSCKLLQSGFFSISRVAELSGFSDAKYFSTVFKKAMKATPKEYMQMYNK